ncbi:MAG: urea carboxylase-associated family protein [Bryobacteraceae bacterium]|nr:urea carboxylase-associated family protein [Bryobacteraceae bacterium]
MPAQPTGSAVLFEETVQPGATWSHVLKRGTALRMTDTDGGANVGAIFYNFEIPAERYNMPDTLKAQHIARLTSGAVLYSDMGRILCSVTVDSLGWHDPMGGASNAALVEKKYGRRTYQEAGNDYYKNTYDSFVVELGKYGLGARDLTANVNFFSKVAVASDGSMQFVEGHSPAGSYIELRAEMNVLAILCTCQHPLDPYPGYAPKPVHLQVHRVSEPGPDDPCRLSRPENGRGFTLTERYFL